MLRCLAIDDEPLALHQIRSYIEKIPYLELVATCNNAIEAQQLLSEHRVDLIFVDINMPDLSGVELVRTLIDKPMVIFTTAYSQYAIDGFRLDAVDYLLKPFGLADFSRAAAKANSLYMLRHAMAGGAGVAGTTTTGTASAMVEGTAPETTQGNTGLGSETAVSGPAKTVSGTMPEAMPKEQEYVSVKADHKVSLVKIGDIVYLESEGEYVRIHLADGVTITTLLRLKNIENALQSERFMRVHRSYIVNLRCIKGYTGGRVFLNNTEYVPIGENYREEFQRYIDANFRNL